MDPKYGQNKTQTADQVKSTLIKLTKLKEVIFIRCHSNSMALASPWLLENLRNDNGDDNETVTNLYI